MDKENIKKSAERWESRKAHSWWSESHIYAKNTKWLSENMEEMDNTIGHMMKLMEDDGDSFAKKADMYYKKRPELVTLVQEFQRMYQALVGRYVQLIGDVPDLHSLLSSVRDTGSDTGSEPTTPWFAPDTKFTRFRSNHRAAGFEVFLGSGGSASDRYSRVDDLYSMSDSEESDMSSVYSYPRFQTIGEEASYEGEIASLKMEPQSFRSLDNKLETDDEGAEEEPSIKTEVSDPDQDLRTTEERLLDVEKQISIMLSIDNKLAHANIRQLQDQLKTVQKDGAIFKAKLDSEMRKSTKWQDRITRYKSSLIDRDVEIRELKEMRKSTKLAHANIRLRQAFVRHKRLAVLAS